MSSGNEERDLPVAVVISADSKEYNSYFASGKEQKELPVSVIINAEPKEYNSDLTDHDTKGIQSISGSELNLKKPRRSASILFRETVEDWKNRTRIFFKELPRNSVLWLKANTGVLIYSVIYAAITISCAQTVWKSKLTRNFQLVLAILWALLFALIKDLPAGLCFLAALTACLSFNIVTPAQALAGFSNTGVFQVAILFPVAEGIKQTGCLDFVLQRVLGTPKHPRVALIRLCCTVAVLSTFLNNTPIVAMMIPIVDSFCRRTGFSQSHFMIPTSYATILGGTISYIGTSVNLIAYNLAKAKEPKLNMSNLFEIGIVGLPVAVAGIIYIVIFCPILLKDRLGAKRRKDVADKTASGTIHRSYSIAVKVSSRSTLDGKSLAEAQARELQHVGHMKLMEVDRDGLKIQNPPSDSVLRSGDRLVFSGPKPSVRDLLHIRGLEVDDLEGLASRRHDSLVEVVVASRSELPGRTARDFDFASRYNAFVVAIQRGNERITDRISEVPFVAGDGLVLLCTKDFTRLFREDPNFATVVPFNEDEDFNNTKRVNVPKMIIAAILAIGMIVIPSVADNFKAPNNYWTLTHTVLLAAYGMLIFHCITAKQFYSSIDGDVLLTIACAFGVGSALENSGVAKAIADSVVGIFSGSKLGLLFGIYIATVLLNAIITNAACVALVFPIVYTALKGQVATKTIVYILMMAGSADFSTPIGYQTNLMVQAPGGYKFLDYTKAGFPLQMICMALSVPICYYVWTVDNFNPS